ARRPRGRRRRGDRDLPGSAGAPLLGRAGLDAAALQARPRHPGRRLGRVFDLRARCPLGRTHATPAELLDAPALEPGESPATRCGRVRRADPCDAAAGMIDGLTFSEYIELGHLSPIWGYYGAGRVRFRGEAEDFTTSVLDLSPAYGSLIAAYARGRYEGG